MSKLKHSLLLIIIVSLLLVTVGCTNNQVSELESQAKFYNEEIIELRYGIKQIKFNSLVINSLVEKSEILDELLDSCEILYGYVRLGYNAKGYEVGMMNLDYVKSKYDIITSRIDYSEENTKQLIEVAQDLAIEDIEGLEDLNKIDEFLSDMAKEFLNAYEQMENYIKTGDNKFVDNYKFHESNIFELHLEATPVAREGIDTFHTKIMDYEY